MHRGKAIEPESLPFEVRGLQPVMPLDVDRHLGRPGLHDATGGVIGSRYPMAKARSRAHECFPKGTVEPRRTGPGRLQHAIGAVAAAASYRVCAETQFLFAR